MRLRTRVLCSLVCSMPVAVAAAAAVTPANAVPVAAHSARGRTTGVTLMLGQRRLERAGTTTPRGRAEAFRFVAAVSGVVSHVELYLDRGTSARSVSAALYAGGRGPTRRLTEGSRSRLRRGHWVIVAVRAVPVRRGKTYWLAVIGRKGRITLRARHATGCQAEIARTRGRLPRVWASARRLSVCHVSAYAAGVPAKVKGKGVIATAPSNPVTNLLAPRNTQPPAVTGSTMVGQTLTVSTGTWKHATSFAYQWEECNISGTDCAAISGATGSSYTLQVADVAHTIRAVVTASNLLASSSATSAATGIVGLPGRDCFSTPSSCADPADTGVGATCAALPSWSPSDLPAGSGSVSGHQVTITANNVTIANYNIGDYFFYVEGNHVTLNDDCISFRGSDWSGGPTAATAVWGTSSASYLTVENSTIIPPGCSALPLSVCTGSSVDETLITSGGAPDATIKDNVLAGAVEDLNSIGSNSTIQGNYIIANGSPGGDIHSEAMFEQDVSGLTIDHNVLLNPMDQSAVIFAQVGSSGSACDNQFTITNNLIAGGGWPLSLCTHASSAGSSRMTITGNHFARCVGSISYDSSLGGRYCGSSAPSAGSSIGAGADGNGYWPDSGFFGLTVAMYCTSPGWTWSANVWDDNGAATSCS